MIKNFKLHVNKFHFSEIMVLHAATLPNKELFHNHFSKFLITIVKWYIIMVQWLCLKIQRLPGRNGKNVLRAEYQKERIKYVEG